jgi:hypothetical protein
MAKFRGTIKGGRGEASRLGHTSLRTSAASWEGAVYVELSVKHGVDWAYVHLGQHHGKGTYRVLYDGPVSGEPFELPATEE